MNLKIVHRIVGAGLVCCIALSGCSSCEEPDTNQEDMNTMELPPDILDMGNQAEMPGRLPCLGDEYVRGGECVACPTGQTNPPGDDPHGEDTSCEERICLEDEYVQRNVCVQCPEGTLNPPGDRAAGADTSCEPVLCGPDEFVQSNTCVSCPAGQTNQPGDDASGVDTNCDATVCAEDQRVQDNVCVSCPAGTTNLAGDDASGQDTSCDAVLCAEDQRVQANACVACVPGATNAAGDDASGPDTQCEITRCVEDEFVQNNACVMCPAGTTNLAGDDASGTNTTCDGILCPSDTRVEDNACVMCPAGTTNEAGDDASGADTTCDATLCLENERVEANVCISCPAGTTSPAGADASGADTMCQATLCLENERVEGNACVTCSPGTTNTAGDDASDIDTLCHVILCGRDEFVQNNTCVSCPQGLVNDAGDNASGPDTLCEPFTCGQNEKVQNNLCVRCPMGRTNDAGDDPTGANTSCDDNCTPFFGVTCDQLQTNLLKASNLGPGDVFGASVSISGDTLVVGATVEDSDGVDPASNSVQNSGAAYVFVRDPLAQTWSEQALLKASNLDADDYFGRSVAISGDTIVVGAWSEDGNGTVPGNNSSPTSGAAYVFVRDPATQTWSEQALLKASNVDSGDGFGWSVAISGDTIVVSAINEASDGTTPENNSSPTSGAAYVFVRDPATQTWSEQAWLKASNADAQDQFGVSVAISGDTIVVGAKNEDSDGNDPINNSAPFSGAAYVFVRDPATQTWSEQALLKASNLDEDDAFGWSVTISGDTLVIGAFGESSNDVTSTNNTAPSSGAAYVFVRDPVTQTWSEQALLKASNLDDVDLFGWSVSLFGNTLVVSATRESSNGIDPNNNSISQSGAAYVFVRDPVTQTWSEQALLKASNLDTNDEFGDVVSISNNTVIVSSRFESSNSTDPSTNLITHSGAAYIFEL